MVYEKVLKCIDNVLNLLDEITSWNIFFDYFIYKLNK